MSPSLTTFLYEAANFLVLAGALGWLFFRPVRQAVIDRRLALEAEAEEAARKLAEAKEAQAQIDAVRSKLQTELETLRREELEAVRQEAEQLRSEARAAAEREREQIRRQAAQLSEAQRVNLAQATVAAAAQTVGRLLEEIEGPDLHAALVQAACRELQRLPAEGLGPVKVESGRELAAEERAALENALRSAAATADFRTLDELGDGVRISTAEGLIDVSTHGLTRFAGQALAKEMSHRMNNHQQRQFNNNV